MQYIPLCINSVVLSNGADFKHFPTGHYVVLKGVQCLVGTELELTNPKRFMSQQMFVETPYLGDENTELEEVVANLEDAIQKDLPFTRLVGVRYAIERYLKISKDTLILKNRQKVFLEKLKELEKEFSHLPEDLLRRVRNFDHHYSYTDDIRVYRQEAEAERILKEDLAKANASEYLVRYRSII